MKNILLALLLCTTAQAQIAIDRISINFDYNKMSQTIMESYRGKQVAFGGEFRMNDMFTAEYSFTQLTDGWRPYNGTGGEADWLWGNTYHDRFREDYVGVRLYFAENYHSQSASLRNKKSYGWYFTLGVSRMTHNSNRYHLEERNIVVDSAGTQVIAKEYLLHGHKTRLYGVGQQFGFGFKQFHGQRYYTDFSLLSSAYRRRNMGATGSYWLDSKSDPDDPYITPQAFQDYLEKIEFFAKNGRGLTFRATIGINLDFKR